MKLYCKNPYMKDFEFTQLWEEEIMPSLATLESSRGKERLRYATIFFGVFGFIMILVTFEHNFSWWVAVIGLLVMVGSFRLHPHTKNSFTDKFRKRVFIALNKTTDLSWDVNPDSVNSSSAEILRDSGLYHGYDNVMAENRLQTTYRTSVIDVSNVTAQMEIDNQPVRTIFKGFVARISIEKPFSGQTVVQTESDGRFFDTAAGGLFDAAAVEETELEWGEFERFLKVKSSDPSEARQIFTPDFMAVLYDWWRQHDEPLRLSFLDDAIYVAFPTEVRLEPNLIGDMENERHTVRNIFEFTHLLEDLTILLVDKQHRRYT